jgi:glycosyltransferase involved in cell wall biosynthesis
VTRPPRISVVIAVRDSPELLRRCLHALSKSDYDAFECIVADDGSARPAADIVEEFGYRSIRLEQSLGPASARNLGAHHASGEILFFTDADVEVGPATLARAARAFDDQPCIAAVIGSYDDSPSERGFFSQYRNLLHHFVHQQGKEEAFTFWSGCGAIRKSVFDSLGGYSTDFRRPAIEDIELGARVRDADGKILLAKDLQVKHLKKWTLKSILVTDVRDRGFPWSLLLAARREMPRDLNLTLSQRLSVVLSCTAALAWGFGAIEIGGLFFALPASALATAAAGPALYDLLSRSRSAASRLATASAAALLFSAMLLCLLLSANSWYGACLAGALLGVAILNRGLFRFLYRSRGPLFAVSAAPYYWLHQLGNGLSFSAAQVVHGCRVLVLAFRQVLPLRASPDRETS